MPNKITRYLHSGWLTNCAFVQKNPCRKLKGCVPSPFSLSFLLDSRSRAADLSKKPVRWGHLGVLRPLGRYLGTYRERSAAQDHTDLEIGGWGYNLLIELLSRIRTPEIRAPASSERQGSLKYKYQRTVDS